MISDYQYKIITDQLGRKPEGCVAVTYEQNGVPAILQMRSMVDGKPFPTLYWLCSRDLYRAVARLETNGLVKRFESLLAEDAEFLNSYQACHRRYVARRWQLMHPEDKSMIEQRGFSELFDRYGIGGISRWDKVRCLHMHVADYFSTPEGEEPNIIGAKLDAEFGLSALTLTL